jgi:hypothetical protein
VDRGATTHENEDALVKKDDALVGAAVSAAVALAAYGLRKALAASDEGPPPHRRDEGDEPTELAERHSSRGAPFLLTVLDSGSDALLPIAEHAAAAAGKWVAEKAPDVVRDRLLPRFIESFRDAA